MNATSCPRIGISNSPSNPGKSIKSILLSTYAETNVKKYAAVVPIKQTTRLSLYFLHFDIRNELITDPIMPIIINAEKIPTAVIYF